MTTVERVKAVDGVSGEDLKKKSIELETWDRLSSRINWSHFILIAGKHLVCIAALAMYAFKLHSVPVKWKTLIWAIAVAAASAFGITAGAHRLWTHRSYKAKLPLKVLLMIFWSMLGFNPLYYWIRDHRVHHKYTETDADPHNAKRGFVFSHIGWVVSKKHPECLRRLRETDMSDILADPVVMFQKRHSLVLKLLFCYVIPTLVPIIFWEETGLHSILILCFIRYLYVVHAASTVNSIAHLWGSRPYNKRINPVENMFVCLIAVGEGSHNYHHTFPSDYKTSEFPYFNFNTTTLFIDLMSKIGWAYDLKQTSPEQVDKVIKHLGYKSGIKTASD